MTPDRGSSEIRGVPSPQRPPVIRLVDERGRPIRGRATISLRPAEGRDAGYRARGKDGEVTHFRLDVPAANYVLSVSAEGYETCRRSLTVDARTGNVVVTLTAESDGEHEDADGIGRRLAWLADIRAYPEKTIGRDARTKALAQRGSMRTPEVLHAHLHVERIANPLPGRSLGDIGRVFRVAARDSRTDFRRSLLVVRYERDDLGWVDESSLRLFRIDAATRGHALVGRSGVDRARQEVQAYIDEPGEYGIFGIPADATVRASVRLFEEAPGIAAGRVRELLFGEREDLTPPRGLGRTIREVYDTLTIVDDGLPEWQLPFDGTFHGKPDFPFSLDLPTWTALGPRNTSGRVRALAAHPTDGDTIFAGSAHAGVWVTNDGARTWRSLMFGEGALEIGALAIHLTDPADPGGDVTLYAGTGTEEFAFETIFPAYAGVGILKSTKSGRPGTWNATAVGNLTDILAILVDPGTVSADPSTIKVYAAGSAGLYVSSDGGGTWSLMMSGSVRSLAMDPSDPGTLYAGVGGSGVVKIDVATSTPSPFNAGVANPAQSSVLVAIGSSEPHTKYAKYATAIADGKFEDKIYRFDEALASWINTSSPDVSGYGTWAECLAVDPEDSNIVIAGGKYLYRTGDAGLTWVEITVDSDHHAAVFSSADHLTAYVGNDHGVRKGVSSSAADAGTWSKMHNGLMLTQFNGIGSSAAGPNIVGGGAQDNGTYRTVGGLTWDFLAVGDGCGFAFDPADVYTMYAFESSALYDASNGSFFKSTDGGATMPFKGKDGGAMMPPTPWFQGPFVTPLAVDPSGPAATRVLFAGSLTDVQRSADGGETWNASSPSLGDEVRAVTIAPSSSAVVYAGTNGGRVWRSADGGTTQSGWVDITGAALPARRLTSLTVDAADANTIYVTYGGFNAALSAGHIFRGKSTDGSAWTWKNLSANLPDTPTYAFASDPAAPGHFWAGTDIGVFESIDGAISWAPDTGLPNVTIMDLKLNQAGDVLRAATYGWGMWQRRVAASVPGPDVYVRDNKLDTGETVPLLWGVPDPQIPGSSVYYWESPDIKVSDDPAPVDGVEFDRMSETGVVRGGLNKLYVQVHNRGPLAAHNVKVKAIWTSGSGSLAPLPDDFWASFPDAWSAESLWSSVDPAVESQTIPTLEPHTPAILAWDWNLPTAAADDTCVLVVVSADKDPVSRSDANPNDHIADFVTPNDKHVAHRNFQIITPMFILNSVDVLFPELLVDLHNPDPGPEFFDVHVDPITLPDGFGMSLLLAAAPRAGARKTTGNEWWQAGSARSTERVWTHHAAIGRARRAVSGVLIGARERVTLGIAVRLPKQVRGGEAFRFAVVQKRGDRIVGGNTYELRIPPAEVALTPVRENRGCLGI